MPIYYFDAGKGMAGIVGKEGYPVIPLKLVEQWPDIELLTSGSPLGFLMLGPIVPEMKPLPAALRFGRSVEELIA